MAAFINMSITSDGTVCDDTIDRIHAVPIALHMIITVVQATRGWPFAIGYGRDKTARGGIIEINAGKLVCSLWLSRIM